jgi:hypothetical protein
MYLSLSAPDQKAFAGQKIKQRIPSHLYLVLKHERLQKLVQLAGAHAWMAIAYRPYLPDDQVRFDALVLLVPKVLVM